MPTAAFLTSPNTNGHGSALPGALADETHLLNDKPKDGHNRVHELRTAPVLSREAFNSSVLKDAIGQHGVLGSVQKLHQSNGVYSTPDDPSFYLNTNTPFSAVVCGLQGAGKSHTVSVMLETMFIPACPAVGSLANPLSGLVLHFGETGSCAKPCEAAFLATSSFPEVQTPKIHVYVSPSSLDKMTRLYASLGGHIVVEPLYFSESELDAQAFLSMMAIGSSDSAPLYMQTVLAILRNMGEKYNYKAFLDELEIKKKDLNPAQLGSLKQRLDLLQTFTRKKKKSPTAEARFAGGQITIIDLSDPFIDPAAACGLFEIIIRLFERADVGTGKVLVVDEAHKYLSQTRTSSGLTNALLSLIRQQRHMAMRVIVSTQEPTVIPSVFIDLCSVVILHRFSSSTWWEHLTKHVSADFSQQDGFDRVVNLKTGEAILLAPSGLVMIPSTSNKDSNKDIAQIGRGYIVMTTRRRVTTDGGASILAVA